MLVTTCTFDSSQRTNVTRMGPSSFDEMCFNFVQVSARLLLLDAPQGLSG